MVAEISTIHTQHGGGPVRRNVVCHFWMLGKCNRNPCRFMHRELPHHNVYQRTSKQPNVLADAQSMKRSRYGLGNPEALSGGSEAKTAQKSSNHVIKHWPSKRSNIRNSLASATGDGGSEYKYTQESISSGTNMELDNVKKIRESNKCSNSSDLIAEGDASEASSKKACEHWMSNNCIKGDRCQYLHSLFFGDWFSLLAKLEGHTEGVSGVAFPSGSDKLYSGSSDGTVRVWDCHTGQSSRVLNLGDKIGSLTSEGPWIFVGLPNVVKAWNIETAAEYNLNGPVGQVHAMAVAFDILFAGSQDGVILAWKGSNENPNLFEPATSLKGHTGAVICLTVGKKRLYSGSTDNSIRVWDLDYLQCIHTLNGHVDAVTSLICWNEYLLSCSLDRTIKVWAATEDDNIEGVVAVCGIYDTEAKPVLLCSCNDNTVHLYDLPSFKERGRIFSKDEVRTMEMGPNGIFFTGDGAGLLNVWKIAESHLIVPQVA
ncbi:zinc finger CCCH domain-containing protein 48 isoform X2 [Manihot esculenta]|uniref:Uncharacterized protein n=2 Tax=Manihot esculenta TaxID=3983 RepID=A0ACB7IAS8_MANES|nr:zinc finger CCCH domain-containing protein 48 isoform X2 [Manihot esculenta]KAG8661513.1 hypothetical protein MANES_01G013500v8 [Manihot esculenta]KAG8661516.1 hypothetical protein MANES_01G013500v8 [Manihot esculenta]